LLLEWALRLWDVTTNLRPNNKNSKQSNKRSNGQDKEGDDDGSQCAHVTRQAPIMKKAKPKIQKFQSNITYIKQLLESFKVVGHDLLLLLGKGLQEAGTATHAILPQEAGQKQVCACCYCRSGLNGQTKVWSIRTTCMDEIMLSQEGQQEKCSQPP
jgi:hypothetical protein